MLSHVSMDAGTAATLVYGCCAELTPPPVCMHALDLSMWAACSKEYMYVVSYSQTVVYFSRTS